MNCIETKYKDQSILTRNAQTDGNPIDLLDTIIGGNDAANQRVGNKIFVRSLHLRGSIAWNANAGAVNCQYVRIMVVQDKMSMGTAPVAADLLKLEDSTAGTPVAIAPTKAFRELDKAMRFNVLLDRKFLIMKKDAALNGKNCTDFSFSKSWPSGLHVTYDSAAGATANIQKNNLWLFMFADTAVDTDNPTLIQNVRVRYTD